MIHYHGCPVSGPSDMCGRFYARRHIMVSFAYPQHIETVAELAQTFALDNGAFSSWKIGKPLDVAGYEQWVREWCRHPAYDFCLIPDVIDGTESDNNRMIREWPRDIPGSVPVWHLHESLDRLAGLAGNNRMVALGSSGAYSEPGTNQWWDRIGEAMSRITFADGRVWVKLHGLRMLDPEIFTRLPLASADSTNAAVNAGNRKRFGMYLPNEGWQRANVIADRIESHQSPHRNLSRINVSRGGNHERT